MDRSLGAPLGPELRTVYPGSAPMVAGRAVLCVSCRVLCFVLFVLCFVSFVSFVFRVFFCFYFVRVVFCVLLTSVRGLVYPDSAPMVVCSGVSGWVNAFQIMVWMF